MQMRRLGVVLIVATATACEAILGGLPDADRGVSEAPADAAVATHDARPREPACVGWLGGARYRRRLAVQSTESLGRYPVRFSLDTLRLQREGKVGAGEPGLSVVDRFGRAVPYVFDGASSSDAAALFAAFEVSRGDQSFYVYYGGSQRGAPSAMDDVFVRGIVTDGSFQTPGTKAWTPIPAARGQGYDIRIEGGRARFTMLGKGDPNDHPVGLCQFTSFPPGGDYAVIYDAGFVNAPRRFRVTTHGLEGPAVASAFEGPVQRAVRAGPVRPGDALLCFVVERLSIETVVDFWVANVRVIPWVREEPAVVPVDPEERCEDE